MVQGVLKLHEGGPICADQIRNLRDKLKCMDNCLAKLAVLRGGQGQADGTPIARLTLLFDVLLAIEEVRAMNITRDRPCQRRHYRLSAPLLVRLEDNEPIQARDWSVDGLAIETARLDCGDGESGQFAPGTLIALTLTLPFQGYNISFDVQAEVMRNDACLIGVRFVDLSERSTELLGYFGEDLIRGRMGSVDDSICRIDIPVTPISTKPTPSHISEMPVRRLPIKTICMTIGYIGLGLFVFLYLGVLLWSSVMRLEIPSSVISTPLQTLNMPVDGRVRQVNFQAGESVNAGDEIIRIEDHKLETAIRASRTRIDAAERNVWRVKQRHLIEAERLKLYQIVSRTDKNIAAAKLAAAREALNAADAHLVRIAKLKKSGAATHAQYDKARREQAMAEAAVREHALVLEKNTAMDSVSDRRHYNHKQFEADLDMLALDLDTAYSALEIEVRKLEDLDRRNEHLVLRAPFDGRIVSLYHTVSAAVGRNEPLVVLERRDAVSVTAFLNQKEVLQVGMHDGATVFIPALNIRLGARVVRIDRSSLILDRASTHFTWTDEEDRTAAVVLHLDERALAENDIQSGLPAVVIFGRRGTSDIWSRLKSMTGVTRTKPLVVDAPAGVSKEGPGAKI